MQWISKKNIERLEYLNTERKRIIAELIRKEQEEFEKYKDDITRKAR